MPSPRWCFVKGSKLSRDSSLKGVAVDSNCRCTAFHAACRRAAVRHTSCPRGCQVLSLVSLRRRRQCSQFAVCDVLPKPHKNLCCPLAYHCLLLQLTSPKCVGTKKTRKRYRRSQKTKSPVVVAVIPTCVTSRRNIAKTRRQHANPLKGRCVRLGAAHVTCCGMTACRSLVDGLSTLWDTSLKTEELFIAVALKAAAARC